LQAALSLLLVGLDMAANSVNLALRDYAYTARAYMITLGAIGAYFAAAKAGSWGLGGVWWGLVLFFGARLAQSAGRAAWHLHGPSRQHQQGEQQQQEAVVENAQGGGDSLVVEVGQARHAARPPDVLLGGVVAARASGRSEQGRAAEVTWVALSR
jgi:hypothetical protein